MNDDFGGGYILTYYRFYFPAATDIVMKLTVARSVCVYIFDANLAVVWIVADDWMKLNQIERRKRERMREKKENEKKTEKAIQRKRRTERAKTTKRHRMPWTEHFKCEFIVQSTR